MYLSAQHHVIISFRYYNMVRLPTWREAWRARPSKKLFSPTSAAKPPMWAKRNIWGGFASPNPSTAPALTNEHCVIKKDYVDEFVA
jgi:hypothetical protein